MKTIAILLDPLDQLKPQKDSSVALMLEAQRQGMTLFVMQANDLYIEQGRVKAAASQIKVVDREADWYTLSPANVIELNEVDAVFMRKDPPFDMHYIHLTYLLELAVLQGAQVFNNPRSIRDCNEKLFTQWFPECCPATLVTMNKHQILEFLATNHDIILKPLDGMGGVGIFYLNEKDVNKNAIIETVTQSGHAMVMAQQFIPEIRLGDKRIILIDGKPVDYVLARVPAQGEFRGNLAQGGQGVRQVLSEKDRALCERVGPELKRRGLLWVGLDVIGDFITEINVTSPTCIRELDQQYGLAIASDILHAVRTRC